MVLGRRPASPAKAGLGQPRVESPEFAPGRSVGGRTAFNQAIEISTALPCRISVYEEGGRTILATIKPTMLLTMFAAPGAAATAQEVETTMVRIMDETCG